MSVFLAATVTASAQARSLDRASAAATGAVLGAGIGALASGSFATGPMIIGAGIGTAFGLTMAGASEHIDDHLYGTGIRVVDDRYGTSLIIPVDDLFSEPGEAIIEPTYYATLNKVVGVLNYYNAAITVSGYTDNIPSKKQQMVLSEQYARALADYLTANGVKPKRIVRVQGVGSMYPIAPNDNIEHRARNRRVEITLHTHLAD